MSSEHHGADQARAENREAVTLASDADRDAAVGMLNEPFAAGRLTVDEQAERVHQAYAARTWQELAGLTADLPDPTAFSAPAGTAGQSVTDVPGLDQWLLCVLLCLCPPVGIAWLLATRTVTQFAFPDVLSLC